MIIPESVKIGPFSYAVKRVDGQIRNDNDVRLAGQIDYQAQEIRLITDSHEDHQGETFLHEAIHGVDHYMALGLSEKQVWRLSCGLMAFLRDNRLLREE